MTAIRTQLPLQGEILGGLPKGAAGDGCRHLILSYCKDDVFLSFVARGGDLPTSSRILVQKNTQHLFEFLWANGRSGPHGNAQAV